MTATTSSPARRVRFWLVLVFLVGIPVQFYLAGRGAFGASNYDAHKSVGDLLHLVTVLAFLATFFGADMRNGRDIGLGFGLFALMTIQAIIPSFKHPEIGALHPLNAILLLGLAVHLLMRDRAAGQPAQVSKTA
jgi:hypothetical protein